jgi:hypothetical protein
MNIEVYDEKETLIGTGIATEMSPVWSPEVPQELRDAFVRYVTEHPNQNRGVCHGQAGGRTFAIHFSN